MLPYHPLLQYSSLLTCKVKADPKYCTLLLHVIMHHIWQSVFCAKTSVKFWRIDAQKENTAKVVITIAYGKLSGTFRGIKYYLLFENLRSRKLSYAMNECCTLI